MEVILEHFKMISSIPRCSHHADKMKEYIKEFAKSCDFEVSEDEAGNILCKKGEPRVALQAHYDMVCIGDTSAIELVQDGNFLKAKNSTLGADNGMGMAIMFWAMQRYSNLECLFTANEEVGLLGAKYFKAPFSSSCLLNLDGEKAGDIYIGCAGGLDMIASMSVTFVPFVGEYLLYEINAVDFVGGHSGVDIDKQIPSAIKTLAYELLQHELLLVSFSGGERRNSIPRNATAIVATNKPIRLANKNLEIKAVIDDSYKHYLLQSQAILKTIVAFSQGVREWDRELNIPSVSINLGQVSLLNKVLRIECSLRAMDDNKMAILSEESKAFFEGFGFVVTKTGWYGAWKPYVGEFAKEVQEAMKSFYPDSSFRAIHAGLECGELIAKQTKKMEAVSIGPTINYPHSTREECDLSSVYSIAQVVKKIIEKDK